MDGLDRYEVENLIAAAKSELQSEIRDLRFELDRVRDDARFPVERLADQLASLKSQIEELQQDVTSLARVQ